MTLILSAVCKNGVCICADKRCAKPNNTYEDNLHKIYRFKNISLIIINHGVNKFNHKMWKEYCSEYEKLNKWTNYNFVGICENFRKFIEINVNKELTKNFQNNMPVEYTKSGIVFCGKTNQDVKWRVYELFWSCDSDGFQLEKKHHGNITLSGSGEKYLKNYLNRNKNIFTNEYWEGLDINVAKKEFKTLFLIATEEKNRLGGNEFSDSFDIECINE